MGYRLVRGYRPGEGDRIVLRRGLKVGGLGRGISACSARGSGYFLALGVDRQGNNGQAQDR